MSAFHPLATELRTSRDVSNVPKGDNNLNVAQENGRSSSVSLLLAAIEPGKAYPRPAAAIVHYLQLQADALHPHLVSFSDAVVSGCPLVKDELVFILLSPFSPLAGPRRAKLALRGLGRGGLSTSSLVETPPHPNFSLRVNPTSPRLRGEVT